MTSSEQSDDRSEPCGDTASLQALDDLLVAAMRIADTIGLAFPAIRIEEALTLVRTEVALGSSTRRTGGPVGSLH